ncbi:MAG: hypothetical protein UIM26_03340, partial [Longicatena sp.]|nr:hypothetical protein [Longicatena sp.]
MKIVDRMKVSIMLEKASSFVASILDGNNEQAKESLAKMELLSNQYSMFYSYLSVFQAMMSASKAEMRIRGFRMYCAIAKWDKYGRIDASILSALSILQDDEAENVAQALEALRQLIPYKRHLLHYIEIMM